MLADFGIALAVSEAGGNRLTETGLSLGTPQYMSPEQATGDRQLDARSDLYSLGAVLYEMLAGEPPVTGPTAQAMIAKLMTERPVHLRVVRSSVPEAVDAAVAKALDKTRLTGSPARATSPARSTSAPSPAPAPSRRSSSRRRARAAGSGDPRAWYSLGLLVAAGAYVARPAGAAAQGGRIVRPPRPHPAHLQRRGVRLRGEPGREAARLRHPQLRRRRLQLRGGPAGRGRHRHPPGARRRHGRVRPRAESRPPQSMFIGTINRHWGLDLSQRLGGPPALSTSGGAMSWACGDSLLAAPPLAGNDSAFQVKVTSIDGTVHDSIRVAGPGVGVVASARCPPGGGSWRWWCRRAVDCGRRSTGAAHVADRVLKTCTCPGRITHDALWLTCSGAGLRVHRPDRASTRPPGSWPSAQDTLLSRAPSTTSASPPTAATR